MTFVGFTKLPQELRDQIWAEAAAIQCQQLVGPAWAIVDGQTEPCNIPHAERQRQALIGYENLPESTENQYIRLYIHASSQTDELRLGENEFQTLVNRLPMATACTESRRHAIEFLRAQVKLIDLHRLLGEELAEGEPILEPVFADMTTVMVTTARYHPEDGPEGFDSVDQVVDVIDRVFGSGVINMIWNAWCAPGFVMSKIYWPHTPQMGHRLDDDEDNMVDQSGHGETGHFMSPDLVLHIDPELYKREIPDGETWYDLRKMLRHTLKISELFSAAAKPLPQLQHVEIDLRTSNYGEIFRTYLETTYQDEVIWIGKHNMASAFSHYFAQCSERECPRDGLWHHFH